MSNSVNQATDPHNYATTGNAPARVVSVAAKRCWVDLLPVGPRVDAVVRGRLFGDERTNTLVVGDHVEVKKSADAWSVDSVSPRRNEFVRQGLRKERQILFSNVDRVLILAALANPPTKPASVDRFLVAALQAGIPAALVLTKSDLDENQERERKIRALYEGFDLPIFPVSNSTGVGMRALALQVSEGVSALIGNSGVGKSSLLNRLIPDLELTTRDVSTWSGKGTHTTSAALLVPYGNHAALIDTPGMKSFVPYGITKDNLAELFPDIAEFAPGCRFRDCRHLSEPGCAVHEAVDSGRLPESRRKSYQRMFGEIEEPY